MSYKKRTLAVLRERIRQYREQIPQLKSKYMCPLCIIYRADCYGCFLNTESSFRHVFENRVRDFVYLDEDRKLECIELLESLLPYLEEVPDTKFTQTGWEDFNEIMPPGWRKRVLGKDEK